MQPTVGLRLSQAPALQVIYSNMDCIGLTDKHLPQYCITFQHDAEPCDIVNTYPKDVDPWNMNCLTFSFSGTNWSELPLPSAWTKFITH